MDIVINYWAVLVAAVAGMVIGALWYSPVLFMKPWMRWSGIDPMTNPGAKQGMWWRYLLSFVGQLVMAYVLAHIISTYIAAGSVAGAMTGLTGGFWVWLGTIAVVMLNSVLWEMKPWKLYFLNIAHYLVVLLVMGLILGGWQ